MGCCGDVYVSEWGLAGPGRLADRVRRTRRAVSPTVTRAHACARAMLVAAGPRRQLRWSRGWRLVGGGGGG